VPLGLRTAIKKVRKAIPAATSAAARIARVHPRVDSIADKKVVHKNLAPATRVAWRRHQSDG